MTVFLLHECAVTTMIQPRFVYAASTGTCQLSDFVLQIYQPLLPKVAGNTERYCKYGVGRQWYRTVCTLLSISEFRFMKSTISPSKKMREVGGGFSQLSWRPDMKDNDTGYSTALLGSHKMAFGRL